MSASQLYFQNAAARITIEPRGYVRLEWKAQATNETDVRAAYEHVLAAMTRHRLGHLLSMQELRPPIAQPIQNWILADWMPRLEALPLKVCIAVVQGPSPIGRLAVRSMTSRFSNNVHHHEFEHEPEALEWLLN